jgi:AcrR family transcriptional regulator
MNRNSRKDELLRAAASVVARSGPATLTLDAVAAEAGVSKGGVLYHFPTKEALILALIEAEIEAFEKLVEKEVSADGRAPGAFARAYVRATVAGIAGNGDSGFCGVAAAFANDEAILGRYREQTAAWRARFLSDGLQPGKAEAIRIAADGLWYASVIGAALPGAEGLIALEAELLALAGAGKRMASKEKA